MTLQRIPGASSAFLGDVLGEVAIESGTRRDGVGVPKLDPDRAATESG
jgi:hypothetical protein